MNNAAEQGAVAHAGLTLYRKLSFMIATQIKEWFNLIFQIKVGFNETDHRRLRDFHDAG